jgi:hypothetical protein
LHINTLATIVLHHISLLYLMHCIILLSAHSCAIAIDHAEPELEVQAEQDQFEDFTNLDLNEDKSRCIKPPSLSFIYLYILFMILGCALGYRSGVELIP